MKAASHVKATEIALELYERDNRTLLGGALGKRRFRNALLKGTRDEDGISFERATN